MNRFCRLAEIMLWVLPIVAWAGGGPLNVLVVVNDESLESLELGHYYREKRSIPEANMVHIRTAINYSIDTATYSNQIRNPVMNYIASSGLSNQIDYIVFSKDIPYRVYEGDYTNMRHAGLTASIFYGLKSSPDAFVSGCDMASGSDSAYYESERTFSHTDLPSRHRYYISTILSGRTLISAETSVALSVAADSTKPTATVFYVRSTDNQRNIQWPQYDHAAYSLRLLDVSQSCVRVDSDSLSFTTNMMGYMIGRTGVQYLDTCRFFPGALGNHLTSFAGYLFDHDPHDAAQMSLLDWLWYGGSGSYGTVVEPCGYTNKFPQARLHFWYARGFNLGESYYMAVRNPYQGIVVGDALCSPYSIPPFVSVSGIQTNQVVSNNVTIAVTGLAAFGTRPVDRIDIFLDGTYLATITNVAPRTFNVVVAAINSTNCSYVVPPGLSLYGVATGLAASINASNLGVTAKAYGDRIEIKQDALGVAGASLSCVPASLQGLADELTIWANTPSTNFLETACSAYEQVTLAGSPVSGDVVRAVVSNLKGVAFTNRVVASTNDTANSLLVNLAAAVNSDTNLQNASGCEVRWIGYDYETDQYEAYFVARTNTWEGECLYLRYDVIKQSGSGLIDGSFVDHLNDNADVLAARAAIFLSEGCTNLSASYRLIVTNLANGPHELSAVAYEGTAIGTQGRVRIPFLAANNTARCLITNPPNGSTFLLGDAVKAQVAASADSPVTSVAFYVEGKRVSSTDSAPCEFSFSTTNYGVGVVGLQARAYATNGISVFSSNITVTVLPDYDFDGLDDNWEVRNFGSGAAYQGADDPDGDGVNNQDEYLADTQPTNAASYFRFNRIRWISGRIEFAFLSSTARQYRLHYNDGSLIDGPWFDGPNWFWGADGVTTQFDEGTLIPLPTNLLRLYRVSVRRP